MAKHVRMVASSLRDSFRDSPYLTPRSENNYDDRFASVQKYVRVNKVYGNFLYHIYSTIQIHYRKRSIFHDSPWIGQVKVGSGDSILFWHELPRSQKFHELFSLATQKKLSLADFIHSDHLALHFHRHITLQALAQFIDIIDLVHQKNSIKGIK